MREEDATDEDCTPPEIKDIAKSVTLNLLPQKSRKQYDIAYNRFREWCADKNVVNYTESVLLAYFSQRSTKVKPSSLWAEYSMVRASLTVQCDVDISKYAKLIAFLKRNAVGFRPKKSKVFTREQVYQFLKEAPDTQYLMKKLVAIFGIAGACRRDELQKMTFDDVEEVGSMLIVKIPRSKTDKERSFVVKGEVEEGINFVDIYRRYVSLRPAHTPHKRIFVHYHNGKCSVQAVGVNTFAKIPCEIATYLHLENPTLFTGHSFRRSSATILANSGANILDLKRHGGWKSDTVAEGYVEESLSNKITTAEKILPREISSERMEADECARDNNTVSNVENSSLPCLKIENNNNCTINLNVCHCSKQK